MKRKLVLANGQEFYGKAFGSTKEVISEVVFNTACVGYQEIISNPVYSEQMICMTYPLIGNYGIIDEDYESKMFGPSALIVKEYNDKPSNFRYTKTLNEVMEENEVVGLTHVDTRAITRVIRDHGSMLGIICDDTVSVEEAIAKINDYQAVTNIVDKVSCKKRWYSRCANPKYNVVAIDCGITYSEIKDLNRVGCNVTIVPYGTSASKIMELKPDGIYVSNGPGNPVNVENVCEQISALQGVKPIFAVGLGHQLLALANGLETYKLPYGHHGSNHPVEDLTSGKIEITTHCQNYAVKAFENDKVKVTHRNLLDDTVEGLEVVESGAFSVQYIPNSASGPNDSKVLLGKFIAYMDSFKEENNA